LDHLGIVAGICREIDLAGQIDRMIGPADCQVSVGETVQAMVLNALGFVDQLSLGAAAVDSSPGRQRFVFDKLKGNHF
jgi:hypothetical protein